MASEAEVTPLRLVFLGSDPIALPLLDWLAGEGSDVARVVAVVTQPDRPAGRGQKITVNAIKAWALAHHLTVYQPEKLTVEVHAQLAAHMADVALVMAYGQILRDEFINLPRLGTLNLHTSMLPKYRGASPIQTAIAGGDRATGVSLMRIVKKLDSGPIADVESTPIGPSDTAVEVEARLATACVPLLARALPRLRAGSLEFTPQDEAGATYCRRLDSTCLNSLPVTILSNSLNCTASSDRRSIANDAFSDPEASRVLATDAALSTRPVSVMACSSVDA